MKTINKKLSEQINEYIAKRVASDEDAWKNGYNKKLAGMISVKFDVEMDKHAVRGRRMRMNLTRETSKVTPQEQIIKDKQTLQFGRERSMTNKKYQASLDENENLRIELAAALEIKSGVNWYKIPVRKSTGLTKATAVVLASDFHIEEIVKSEKVNGLNEFNLTIARKRVEEFFQNTLKLIIKEQGNAQIDDLILALLGDFISGNIHEELLENCSLRPVEAIIEVQNMLISGIEFLLKNSKLNITVPCHVGNHTRITKKVHISTEQGNNLEYFMYYNIKNHFRNNKRIKFIIADSYLSYVKVYDFTIRFHHGHALKYGGGIGGLFIPTFKAISQWQKMRHADLDCFGHFHQFKDGGNFICNGSIIGYNAYALTIKADFETPRQTFFLVDSKRGCKTVTTPILFSV